MTATESPASLIESGSPLPPETQSLASGLRQVLRLSPNDELTILSREHNVYSSGSLSEVVTCRLSGSQVLQLFVKHGQIAGTATGSFVLMPWSNVPYEAEVYREVLQPLCLSCPKFYGTYQEPGSRRFWLVLENFPDAMPLQALADGSHMALAARWLGRFHASSERYLANTSVSFLKKIEPQYYSALAGRAISHGRRSGSLFSWLPELCSRFQEFIAPLSTVRPAVIHGDFYPNNILVSDGNIHPVDWEEAAVAPGEMDLASLTFRWPAEIARRCEVEYQVSRWPQGAPDDFGLLLNAARLALYLGEMRSVPNWTDEHERGLLSKEIRSLGEQLGLI